MLTSASPGQAFHFVSPVELNARQKNRRTSRSLFESLLLPSSADKLVQNEAVRIYLVGVYRITLTDNFDLQLHRQYTLSANRLSVLVRILHVTNA